MSMFYNTKRLILLIIISLTLVGCVGMDPKKDAELKNDNLNTIIKSLSLSDSKIKVNQHEFSDAIKLAEQGEAKAQLNVGLSYLHGAPVTTDLAKASYWLQKSAEQGNLDGQRLLGTLYRFGIGVFQDSSQELFWYTKAAENGDYKAQIILGYKYYYGIGVSKDVNRALELWKKSADSENEDAQVFAQIFLDGHYKPFGHYFKQPGGQYMINKAATKAYMNNYIRMMPR